MKNLSNNEIIERIKSLDSSWIRKSKSISRQLKFKNFIQAFTFMKSIALEAEKINHHPTWENKYNMVKITLSTHDSGGLTEKDFELARIIDITYKPFSQLEE